MLTLLDSRSMTPLPNESHTHPKDQHKSAYRRCHLSAQTAVQTITQLPEENLCILMLHLTFGEMPCPFEWNIFFKSISDLADVILHSNDWDPETLQADCKTLVPKPMLLHESIPFAEGLKQVVNIDINPRGTRQQST